MSDKLDPARKKFLKMYQGYVNLCVEQREVPPPFDVFLQRIAEKINNERANEAQAHGAKMYYLARQVGDKEPNLPSIKGECGQCGSQVWIDVTMKQYVDRSEEVVCEECVGEVTGKGYDDAVAEALK